MKFIDKLISDYRSSSQRLLLLDYDGTLTPFFERPKDAKPEGRIINLLEGLTQDPNNEVVLISGRDKGTLEKWFEVSAGFAAEHGAWIKERGGRWETIEQLRSEWKSGVRPFLEKYADKTPGSFIEEKDFSLAWHYRNVEPELGGKMAGELIESLKIPKGHALQVLLGDKVVEIKNACVNKGRAALRWIRKKRWDFILAIGDDMTDEDVFDVLPKSAYSIKVGEGPSRAKFRADSPSEVLSLLEELVSTVQ